MRLRYVDGFLRQTQQPRGKRTISMRAHELLALVMPGYGSERFLRLTPEFRLFATQVPQSYLARFKTDQQLYMYIKQTQKKHIL